MRVMIALCLMFTCSFQSAWSAESDYTDEQLYKMKHPLAAYCSNGKFTLDHYPLLILEGLVSERLDDPFNRHLRAAIARCVEPSGDVLDVCGVSVRMNSVGYIDQSLAFAVRFFPYAQPPKITAVQIGASAKQRCAAFLGPT